ncbi:hypothetical protein J4N45_09910 [Vibrio sp. SCSIO 43140]|uniref:hypothetical protein n=1 Tax=Vibrio sp. SCSIO 43140 TaxID=2819100 RepID=UPI0020764BAD|nr:hypothetical protein [Vibrio sp. SCSIO 43140]USD58843.1 hypothetical protein J4N45_09910 [Vibrio sp. SCSIO 43140]
MNTQAFKPGPRPVQKPQNHPSHAANESSSTVHNMPTPAPNQPAVSQNSGHALHQQPPQNHSMTPSPSHSKPFPSVQSHSGTSSQPSPESNAKQNPFKKQGANPTGSQNNQNTDFRKIHSHGYKVHGGRAALEIKPDTKQKARDAGLVDENGEENIFHTIRLEAAQSNNSGDRTYNWGNKIALQLTDIELPLFIGVCMGYFPRIEFGNHGVGGEKSSKSFTVEFQKNNLFVSLSQKDKSLCAVPINFVQANHIGLIALEVYTRNFSGLDSQTVLNSIINLCSMYLEKGDRSIKDRA